jgi:hypothetical protein
LATVFGVLFLIELIAVLVRNSRSLIYILFPIVILHALLFRQAALSYRYAGDVARRSLVLLDTKTAVRTLYVLGLPSQYRGALIFRSGLTPGVEWIDSCCAYRRIMVLSSRELLQRKDSIPYEEQGLQQSAVTLKARIKAEIRADTASRGWEIALPDTSFVFVPGKDRIVYWTDSTFVEIRK